MSYKFLDGFTKDEIKFMETVPEILRTESMVCAAAYYNDTFNTDLSTDEFHDRFDDYMKQLVMGPQEEDDEEEIEEKDSVCLFFEENRDFMSPSNYCLLQKYDAWKEKKYQEMIDEIDPQIKSWDALTKSLNDITKQFLKMC